MPSRPRLDLSESNRRALTREANEASAREVRRACQAILSLANGTTSLAVAKELGVHRVTVSRWLACFRREGPKGLLNLKRPRTGRPPKLKIEHREQLKQIALTPPNQLGKPFKRWTLTLLARHLAKESGVRVRPHYLGQILRQMGITRQQLAQPDRPRSGFQKLPPTAIIWFLVGSLRASDPSISETRKRILYAGVDLQTGQLITHQASRRQASQFLKFLAVLVEQYPRHKILLIAEEGSFHPTWSVMNFVRSLHGQLEIVVSAAFSRSAVNSAPSLMAQLSRLEFLFNSPEAVAVNLLKALEQFAGRGFNG